MEGVRVSFQDEDTDSVGPRDGDNKIHELQISTVERSSVEPSVDRTPPSYTNKSNGTKWFNNQLV